MESEQVGEYLIKRLTDLGIRHMFGIPGDYVLGFYDLLGRSADLQVINTCDEQCAGFAADAYAEKSPVVVISGAPNIADQQQRQFLHHQITAYGMQKGVFEKFTIIDVKLDKHHRSPALTRLTKKLGEKVQTAQSGRITSHGGHKQY